MAGERTVAIVRNDVFAGRRHHEERSRNLGRGRSGEGTEGLVGGLFAR